MLGLGNTRVNQLEAENRRLRAELLAQTQRADAQSRIIANLQRENETAAYQLTQQAQAGRGFILNEPAIDRLCWN